MPGEASQSKGSDACAQTPSWFFQNARELFGVVSPAGVFLEVNPAWSVVTGWAEADLLGRNLLDFLHEDSKRR